MDRTTKKKKKGSKGLVIMSQESGRRRRGVPKKKKEDFIDPLLGGRVAGQKRISLPTPIDNADMHAACSPRCLAAGQAIGA